MCSSCRSINRVPVIVRVARRADEAVGGNQVCFHYLGSHSLSPFCCCSYGCCGATERAAKPITVVEEKKPEQSSEACCRCEDRFNLMLTERAV